MGNFTSNDRNFLHFRAGIDDAGFSSSKTSNASNADATTIVRELLQNSLDAANEIQRPCACIRFEIEQVEQNHLPGLDELQKVFPRALNAQKQLSGGSLPDIQEQIASIFEANLKNETYFMLSILDNGVGLNKISMRALLGDGRSAKSTGSGGAHGYGHLTVLPASDIRLAYYGGVSDTDEKVASGHCILAPFQDENGVCRTKDGYLVEELKEDLFEPYVFLFNQKIPKLISDKLEIIENKWGSGSAVLVPSFNFFKQDENDLWKAIKKAAATNFFAAFAQKKITVEFKEGKNSFLIDSNNIREILTEFEYELNAKSFISGYWASNCYQVVMSGESVDFTTDLGPISGKLTRHKKGQSTRIDLCRNGMWIVYGNSAGKQIPRLQSAAFTHYQPFHLVLLSKASDGDLHDLIRKAEPPIHDQIDVRQLTEADRKALQGAFTQIRDQLRAKLEKINAERVIMDDILVLPTGDVGTGGGNGFYAGEWQPFERSPKLPPETPTEQGEESGPPRNGDKTRRDGRGSGGGGTKTRKRPGANAPFRAISVPIGARKYEVEVYPLEDIEMGEIRFMVDQNMDETCKLMNAEPLVRLKNVKIDDQPILSEQVNTNNDGETIGVFIPNITRNKIFCLKFDFFPSGSLLISKHMPIALKAEIIRRQKTKLGK